MLDTTEKIFISGLGDHVIRDIDLAALFEGSDARRYGLVNKAIKAEELIPLRRGLYLAHSPHRPVQLSQYYLANHLVPFSFVTAESALSYHGWIPERVTEVVSLSAFGRRKTFINPYGHFSYFIFKGDHLQFLQGVERVENSPQAFWMAKPLRALLDYIVLNKKDRVTVDFLEKSLRIDPEMFLSVELSHIEVAQSIYNSHRIQRFLTHFKKEIQHASVRH
jgi:hypothetical protein